jgi:hypothetical protein
MVSEVTNANADDFLGVSDVLVENMVRDCFAKRWAFLMVHNLWNMVMVDLSLQSCSMWRGDMSRMFKDTPLTNKLLENLST